MTTGVKGIPWARGFQAVEKEEKRQPAEKVAARTFELLSSQGWCLWKCDVLNGDIIVVVRDELVEGFPDGPPVYTEGDLIELLDVEASTIRLVHKAKELNQTL